MQITDNKLIDLYRRFINFVSTNYPDAVITENKLSTMVNYPGELARLFIYQDKPNKTLLVKISKDITQKMSDTNGRLYYLSSIDELNSLKSGVQVIMDLKMPASSAAVPSQTEMPIKGTAIEPENDSQCYLYGCDKKLIGIVYKNLIPTNAFVHSNDQINIKPVEYIEDIDKQEPAKTDKKGSISRFFKR